MLLEISTKTFLISETCDSSHNFLLSLQSYSFFPTFDKPTRVYNNSATLIDNVFVNRIDSKLSSSNIVSDISDHYSQFALFHSPREKTHLKKGKIRDYSNFVQDAFNTELLQIAWKASSSVEESFAQFYNKLNKIIIKHAPLKTISRQQTKQFAKRANTSGLQKSVKVKNSLFSSGDTAKYKQYRNKISSLTRLGKKLYYQAFFEANLNNMKKNLGGH